MKITRFFLAGIGLVFFVSCPVRAQDIYSPEIVRAFANANLPLINQKVTPQDFSLPQASLNVPESLARPTSLSGLKGKVVFLNFWATWCGPCRIEMPSMEALYAKYRDRGLEILAVNSGERASDVLAFLAENRFTFPVVMDTDGKVSRTYGIQAIPTSYLIGRDGQIISRMTGSIDWNTPQIYAVLELLLN